MSSKVRDVTIPHHTAQESSVCCELYLPLKPTDALTCHPCLAVVRAPLDPYQIRASITISPCLSLRSPNRFLIVCIRRSPAGTTLTAVTQIPVRARWLNRPDSGLHSWTILVRISSPSTARMMTPPLHETMLMEPAAQAEQQQQQQQQQQH
jgi:hypothetical protein